MPIPNPGLPGDDKIKHVSHELNSSDSQKLYNAAHAYVHAPVEILPAIKPL
ncbi:MAG TPA: hypothetical protein PLX87_04410 [Bacteroidales bacterium]|nr:hypothetical protein [Bacteroidales bacterium]HPP92175.1 hypothetical protein [Bacteroidales bacterium]HQK72086.1 hypothetical protein [Bacteroidales bacterium]